MRDSGLGLWLTLMAASAVLALVFPPALIAVIGMVIVAGAAADG